MLRAVANSGGGGGGTGPAGADGKTVRYGTGAPSNALGVDGDFYIATDTNFIYGPKVAGVWPSGTSLVGPAGANGANGQGVPIGGTSGQVLTKNSATNYDTIWQTPSSGGLPALSIDSVSSSVNRYFTSQARSVASSTMSFTALTISYVPFFLLGSVTAQSLGINITIGGTSALARMGIYSISSGYMGTLLATTGDVDVSTAGFKTGALTSSLAMTPGWYFVAFITSVAVTASGYTSAAANITGGSPLGFSSSAPSTLIDFRQESAASIALPATASATTTPRNVGVQHSPMVFVGV